MVITSPQTKTTELRCSGACWYDIVIPVAMFAIVFVGLTVFCKCSKEIYKRCLRRDNSTDDGDERRNEGRVNENYCRNVEDLPPSYSSVQMALPQSETFPVESISEVDALRSRFPKVATDESFSLPTYEEIQKAQKQSGVLFNADTKTVNAPALNNDGTHSDGAVSQEVIFEL